MRLRALTAVAVLLCAASAQAQKHDHALVYGDGFALDVRVPDGWRLDSENAGRFDANVLLYRTNETPETASALFRIRLNPKVDENTGADLQFDLDHYRRDSPKVKFEDFPVDHVKYKCFSRLYFVDGQFYDYITYVNPGPDVHFLLSVSLHRKARATKEEIEAIRNVVRSLDVFPGADIRDEGK